MSEKNSNTPESTADTNSSANESAVLSTQKQVKGSSSRQIGSIATGDTAAAQAAKDASIKSHVEQKQAKEKTAESETKENRDRNTETEITSNVKEKVCRNQPLIRLQILRCKQTQCRQNLAATKVYLC